MQITNLRTHCHFLGKRPTTHVYVDLGDGTAPTKICEDGILQEPNDSGIGGGQLICVAGYKMENIARKWYRAYLKNVSENTPRRKKVYEKQF